MAFAIFPLFIFALYFCAMNLLVQYLKNYKWIVCLALVLAAINIGFSLLDPYIT